MSEFKAGDRVAVYGWTYDGVYCNGAKATLNEQPKNGRNWRLTFDGLTSADSVHEVQLRRLVKKRPRTCTLQYSDELGWLIEDYPDSKDLVPGDLIRFVEVKKK